MAKLTKKELRQHGLAVEILEKSDPLSHEEKELVLQNYHEAATNTNGESGAFFTPLDLAWDHAIELGCRHDDQPTIIDLCSGIGVLAYTASLRYPEAQLTCVEINSEYVSVGKRILPDANWLTLDIGDLEELQSLGQFDYSISNPPFGRVRTFRHITTPRYKGAEAEFKVIDIASHISSTGVFIIPQDSSGFRYSASPYFERRSSKKHDTFLHQTNINLEMGCGIDTSIYSPWKSVNSTVEIVCADFEDVNRSLVPQEIQQELSF